ncbi:hypothetical protein MOO44_04115 [Nicoliella spurrieriana]|uniref:Glycosyltransferase RgtA/B/C/D-like domain-containing protein n=1 Tax=Nicoliella spurrieriana TaxID=2925830 RepID=A0A976X5V3_9LACO|nr:hypothetical protein [Nicoliella spurrieriana]UQS87345.1 hypothetical protein MOO44_04115 [Nicoliella spurrieriana]
MKLKPTGLHWPAIIGTLLFSFLVMLFISTSSPLYTVNSSPDANIMMTVGKGLLHNLLPYRDLFDNRGPLIYLLYSLAALVSYHSFIFIYVFESILLFFDLILGYLILRQFIIARLAYPLTLFMLPLMFNEYFFQHGDTPESIAIPFLLLMIYQLLKHQDLKFTKLTLYSQGLFVGIAFWIKYTFLFPWFGVGLVLMSAYFLEKRFADFFKLIGFGLLGYLTVTVPIIIFYHLHHSLATMLKVYFLFNVKYYQHSNFDLTQFVKLPQIDPVSMWVEGLVVVMVLTIILLPRVIWTIKAALLVSLSLETLSIITVKVTATYYYTLISVFSILILVLLGIVLQKILPKLAIENPFLICLLVVLSAYGMLTLNQNYRYSSMFPHNAVYSLDHHQTTPYQERFAKIINRSSDRSLLVYRTIDVSMYTTLGTLPQSKYFVKNNLDYQPMINSQKEQLKSLKNKFVVTISLPPTNDSAMTRKSLKRLQNKTLRRHYHLVDTATVLKYTSFVYQYPLKYYLYERND